MCSLTPVTNRHAPGWLFFLGVNILPVALPRPVPWTQESLLLQIMVSGGRYLKGWPAVGGDPIISHSCGCGLC